MISFCKVDHPGTQDKLTEYIAFINETRRNYPYSQKVYTKADVKNLYVIISSKTICGFCEVEIRNISLEAPKPVDMFLHELHIAKNCQRKGIGEGAIRRLLELEVPIEMVVANKNESMLALVAKVGGVTKYRPKDVQTIVIHPMRKEREPNV